MKILFVGTILLLEAITLTGQPLYTVADLGPVNWYDESIAATNNRGQVASYCRVDSMFTACVYDRGRTNVLGIPWNSRAYGLNERGDVVGSFITPDGVGHPFFHRKGTTIDLGEFCTSDEGAAYAVNNRGQAVGYTVLEGGYLAAALWENGEVYELGQCTEPPLPGLFLTATDINNNGEIICWTFALFNPYYQHAFLLTPIHHYRPPPPRLSGRSAPFWAAAKEARRR